MEELEKLYQVVSSRKLYTKDFDSFKAKYQDDPEAQAKLYNVVSSRKLYSKSQDEFLSKYFKKKELVGPPSPSPLSGTQEDDTQSDPPPAAPNPLLDLNATTPPSETTSVEVPDTEGLEEDPEQNYWGKTARKAAANVLSLAQGGTYAPDAIFDAVAEFMGEDPKGNADKVTMLLAGQSDPMSKMLAALRTGATSGKIDELRKDTELYEETFDELVSNKEYAKAGLVASQEAIANFPATLGVLLTGGVGSAALATSAGGQKYKSLENVDASYKVKAANAAFTGLAEFVFEKLGTEKIGKSLRKRIFEKGREATQDVLESSFKKMMKDALSVTGLVSAPILEGATEAATTWAENITDWLTINPDQDLSQNTLLSFVSGAISGGGMSLGGTVVKKAVDIKDRAEKKAFIKEAMPHLKEDEAAKIIVDLDQQDQQDIIETINDVKQDDQATENDTAEKADSPENTDNVEEDTVDDNEAAPVEVDTDTSPEGVIESLEGIVDAPEPDVGIADTPEIRDNDSDATQSEPTTTEDDSATTQGQPATTEGSQDAAQAQVFFIPTQELTTDTDSFQGRDDAFSENSAKNVSENFDNNLLAPVSYWVNPETNQKVILAGHSRLEGHQRLEAMEPSDPRRQQAVRNGWQPGKIKAEQFKGTFEQAQEFAKNSNVLGTQETVTERAQTYRDDLANGIPKSAMRRKYKKLDGKNFEEIYRIAQLDPNSKAVDALKAFSKADSGSDTSDQIKKVVNWVGKAVEKYGSEALPLERQNEIFDHLSNKRNMDGFRSQNDFIDQIDLRVNTLTYNADEPLNLGRIQTKSDAQKEQERIDNEYTRQIKDIDKEINRLQERRAKIDREKSPDDVARLDELISTERQRRKVVFDKRAKHRLNADRNKREGSRQQSIFASTGNVHRKSNPVLKRNFRESDLDSPKRLRGVVDRLMKDMNIAAGRGLRLGLISRWTKKALGLYFPGTGHIRIKSMESLDTFVHELGHKIDLAMFKLSNENLLIHGDLGRRVGKLVKITPGTARYRDQKEELVAQYGPVEVDRAIQVFTMKNELIGMLLKDGYPDVKVEEGIAEFVRKFVTDPKGLSSQVPTFYDYWTQLLDAHPTLRAALQTARDGYKEWDSQDVRVKIESTINRGEESTSWMQGIKAFFSKDESGNNVFDRLVYDIADHTQLFKSLQDQLDKKIPHNDFQVANKVLATIGVDGIAKQFLEFNPTRRIKVNGRDDIEIRKDIRGFLNILSDVSNAGKMQSFEGYMIARRNVELHNRQEKARSDLKELAQLDRLARKVMKAAKELLPLKKIEPSKLTPKQVQKISDLTKITQQWDQGKSDRLSELMELQEHLLIEKDIGKAATMSKDESSTAVDAYNKDNPEFTSYADEVQAYQTSLLEYMLDASVISQDQFDQMTRLNKAYVPFQRYFEEWEIKGKRPSLTKELLTEEVSTKVKRIRGSERAITPPFAAIIQNTYQMIASAEKNRALTEIVEGLRALDPENIQAIPSTKVTRGTMPNGGSVPVFVSGKKGLEAKPVVYPRVEGKEVFYEIPADYYKALFGNQGIQTGMNWYMKILSAPTRWLQAGAVVYDPTFAVNNVFRDQVSALFYTKFGYNPLDFMKGIFETINKGDVYQKWQASGADFAFLTDIDKIMSKDFLDKKAGRKIDLTWKQHLKGSGSAILKSLRALSVFTESGTRVGAFRNAIKNGGNIYDAMREARDIAGDYGTKGKTLRGALPLYPFLNAILTHAVQTPKAIIKNPVRTAKIGTILTGASLALWAYNNSDEEKRKLYAGLPQWQKIGFWNIHIPGTQNFVPIPRGGVFGFLFGALPEYVMDSMFEGNPVEVKNMLNETWRAYSPITSFHDLTFQAIRPAMENYTNMSFFRDRPIVPKSLQILDNTEQYTDFTPETYKAIARFVDTYWPDIPLDLNSPMMLKNFVEGYFGGAARGAITISDYALGKLGLLPEKQETTWNTLSKLPLTRAIFRASPTGKRSRQVSEFYENMDKLEKLDQSLMSLMQQGMIDEAAEKVEKDQGQYRWYIENKQEIGRYKDALRFFQDNAKMINDAKYLNDEQKRRKLQAIDEAISDMAIRINEAMEKGRDFVVSHTIDMMTEDYRDKRSDNREINEDARDLLSR